MKKATIILFMIFSLQGQTQQLENSKPNIIIIMPDDISFGQHSYFEGFYNTPQIDKLFNEGKELTNFHTSPTCAPTRASLMSGRNEFYSGITHTILMRDQMNLKQTILPENLKKAGYTTAMYGKWHLGDGKEYRPLQRGFDEVLQHGAGGIGQNYDHSADFPANLYNNPTLLHNEEIIETEGYCTDIFFDSAIQWIDKVSTKKKPFFIYLSLNVAHNPQQPPTGKEGNASIIENMDDNVGKLMTYLEEQKLLEKTLIIYFTDNGNYKGSKVKDLNAGKGSATEGGILAPCVFYWKGKIENDGTKIDQLTGHIDLYNTLAALSGASANKKAIEAWDGINILPYLENANQNPVKERYFITHRARWRSSPIDKYKYTEASIQNEVYKLRYDRKGVQYLHNLDEDLSEKINLKDSLPEVVAKLDSVYTLFWEDSEKYMINDTIEVPEIHKPFHELYREHYGEAKYLEAVAKIPVKSSKKNKK